ncbi:MAG: toxin ParE1/3/4 [Phenylobacterium sp.]|jgi:toxin ParE1/3/4
MLNISKSPLALKDAQDIWVYTYHQWGETQANAYLQGLDDTIRQLAQYPATGISINEVRQGYRRCRYKSHLIIYQASETTLDIMRILHGRMDITRHPLQ